VEKGEDVPGPNATPDPLHQDFTHLRQLYFASDADFKGRFTVPVLWDKKLNHIVNNESSEIIRMFYTEFDDIIEAKYKSVDLFPKTLQKTIDETNEWTYDTINNGVYKSGFATTQAAYEKNVIPLFKSLDRVETHLKQNAKPYYWGSEITETDVRLFTTIIRFDPVYVQHFKCNIKDIRSGYPAIHKWMRKLYWDVPAFKETTQFEHIKFHYTKSHNCRVLRQLDPFQISYRKMRRWQLLWRKRNMTWYPKPSKFCWVYNPSYEISESIFSGPCIYLHIKLSVFSR
jgi:glutathionyl-hydroquinone reductase